MKQSLKNRTGGGISEYNLRKSDIITFLTNDKIPVNLKKKKAFTLSEVLITLVVIGVIAAITLPTLIADWHKQETISRLKKAYSTLAQTTNRAIADNGPIETWEVNEASSQGAYDFASQYMLPYLSTTKVCGLKTDEECAFKYKTLKGESKELNKFGATTRFFLSDGTKIALVVATGEGEQATGQKYAYTFIDINGDRGPNRMGRDVFVLIYFIKYKESPVLSGKFIGIYPQYERSFLLSSSTTGCNKTVTSAHANYSCAELIMRDGWQISDDYPW